MNDQKINSRIIHILENYQKIAVVGLSDNPARDSFGVATHMLRNGYQVFPVNPNYETVLGITSYSTLKHIPEEIELVDIFRKSDMVLPIIDEAIQIGARAVWMQLGVINQRAAQKALSAGLEVVMNRCWKVEYSRYVRSL
ncbi:MAG: CoA-binding protein [Calditrichaeota bacterium]|nr:CoA-binding protein [Calditrichota bacterium]RQW03857.1 MAG: CoA-binding protein [Calditrichota bacterium]